MLLMSMREEVHRGKTHPDIPPQDTVLLLGVCTLHGSVQATQGLCGQCAPVPMNTQHGTKRGGMLTGGKCPNEDMHNGGGNVIGPHMLTLKHAGSAL